MARDKGHQNLAAQAFSLGINIHESETGRQRKSINQSVKTTEGFILPETWLSLVGRLSDEFTAELLSAWRIYCFELLAGSLVEGLISRRDLFRGYGQVNPFQATLLTFFIL